MVSAARSIVSLSGILVKRLSTSNEIKMNIREFIHKRERVLRVIFVRDTRTQNGGQILRVVVIGTNGRDNRSKRRRVASFTFLLQFGKSIEAGRL